jgi:phage-related protein
MFDGSISCWIPDIPVKRDDEWRLRIAEFGDGYQQRTLDGINPLNRRWSLLWDMREADVINAMVAYLETRQAAAFPYLEQQTGLTYTVFCDAWQVSWELRRKGPVFWGSLAAEFYKANGVDI